MPGLTRISRVSIGRTIVVCPWAMLAKGESKSAPQSALAAITGKLLFKVRILIIGILQALDRFSPAWIIHLFYVDRYGAIRIHGLLAGPRDRFQYAGSYLQLRREMHLT